MAFNAKSGRVTVMTLGPDDARMLKRRMPRRDAASPSIGLTEPVEWPHCWTKNQTLNRGFER